MDMNFVRGWKDGLLFRILRHFLGFCGLQGDGPLSQIFTNEGQPRQTGVAWSTLPLDYRHPSNITSFWKISSNLS